MAWAFDDRAAAQLRRRVETNATILPLGRNECLAPTRVVRRRLGWALQIWETGVKGEHETE